MDHERLDIIARSLGAAGSRRGLGRAIAGGGLGALFGSAFGALDADAKKKAHKKKHKKRRGQSLPQLPTSPPAPLPVLTYQCAAPKTGFLSGAGGTDRLALTFIAARSGSLRQIQFNVNKPMESSGDYLVELLKVVGGQPSNSSADVLATVTVPNAAVATSSEATVTATFAGPVLVAGTEYAAAISRPGTGPGGMAPNVVGGDGSVCSGKVFFSLRAGTFYELLTMDSLVSVLVQ